MAARITAHWEVSSVLPGSRTIYRWRPKTERYDFLNKADRTRFIMRRTIDHCFAILIAFSVLLSATLSPYSIEAARAHETCCGPITPAGDRLASILDGMDVESLWLAHEHVNWESGEPDRGANDEGPGNHTHCSAFAAAAARKLGVYLLRPPEHGQVLLSNAQAKWLAGDAGRQAGWRNVPDMREAQRLANRGQLVLVLYQNPDTHLPGHIAIVRPSEKSAQALEENGPELIQAGEHNHNKINVRIGFENHPGAWPHGVRYYMHPLSK